MTTLVGGEALTRLGLAAAAPIMAVAAATTFLIGVALPRPGGTAAAPRRSNLAGDVKRLLSSKIFLLALAAAALVQGAHAVYYAFSILHWSSLGFSPRIVGALWAAGVGAEIFMLTRMRALTRRLNPAALIAVGAGGAAVRWTLTGLEPPLAVLFLVQTLHALSFAATYVGTIEFLWRATPSRLINSAMTLNSTAGVGAATGIATIIAGYVFAASGPQAAYFMMAAMAAAGLCLALVLARQWRGELLFD
jgi:PPP family 3-phenylpropionic acid transporter